MPVFKCKYPCDGLPCVLHVVNENAVVPDTCPYGEGSIEWVRDE